MATSLRANTKNFIRFYKTSDLTQSDYLLNGVPPLVDNVNGGTVYTPDDLWSQRSTTAAYMVAGATFSSYCNLNLLESSANFPNWRLKIINTNINRTVEVDLGNVFTQYIIIGNQYRFSFTFTVPSLTGACYELAIVDDSENVLYVSEDIGFTTVSRGLEQIRYRNNTDRNNYDYSLTAEDFYNQYYVATWMRPAGEPTVREGYVLSTGSFTNVRDTSGSSFEFINQAYELRDHRAFNIAILHGAFNIVYEGNWTKFSLPEGSSYEYEFPQSRDGLADGAVTLEQDDTFTNDTVFDEPVQPDSGMQDIDGIFMADFDGVIMEDIV